MDEECLFTVAFIDEELFFYGPKGFTEERFQELCFSLLEQCAIIAYEQEIEEAKDRGMPNLLTWRLITSHLPALLENYNFRQIRRVWTAVPFYNLEECAPKLLGKATNLVENYNKAAMAKYKEDI